MASKAPNLKWLLQHSRSIYVRNLWLPVYDDSLSSTVTVASSQLPTVCMEILIQSKEKGQVVVLQSSMVKETLNPSWSISGLTTTDYLLENYEAQIFYVRIFAIRNDERVLVLEESIDMSMMVLVKSAGSHSYPINTVLINLDDGVYTTENIFKKTFPKMAMNGKYLEMDDVTDSDVTSSLILSKALYDSNQRLSELREDVSKTWTTLGLSDFEILKIHKEMQIRNLENELKEAEQQLLSEIKLQQEEEVQLVDQKEIVEATQLCLDLQESSQKLATVLEEKKVTLLKSRFILEARQIKLLGELQTIYPIEMLESGEYAIRGLELPNDLNSKDEDQIASALSYVAHLLQLASKYLEIPLRYQILFLGSRSMIRDPVQGNSVTMPLFRRNVEKERFERGIFWMKRDIEQLLVTRGIPYQYNRDMLYNLNQLFLCEMCPKLSL